VSAPEADRNGSDVSTLERLIALARRGHARYSERAAAFSRWLRQQFTPEEGTGDTPGQSRLRRWLAARHLMQRQQTYRRAGGREASVARIAEQRAADLSRRLASRDE
jgi:hypothetical protein